MIEEWFELLRNQFRTDEGSCVAVHCVAGLGRAPVLVALALIELGLKYEDAVQLIREYVHIYYYLFSVPISKIKYFFRKRRGAINSKQLAFLEKYRPKSKLKMKNGHKTVCCIQ